MKCKKCGRGVVEIPLTVMRIDVFCGLEYLRLKNLAHFTSNFFKIIWMLNNILFINSDLTMY